jgi:hypothetical protein
MSSPHRPPLPLSPQHQSTLPSPCPYTEFPSPTPHPQSQAFPAPTVAPPPQHPHNHNLPFPNFNGEEDHIGSLSRCEIFYNQGTSEMDKSDWLRTISWALHSNGPSCCGATSPRCTGRASKLCASSVLGLPCSATRWARWHACRSAPRWRTTRLDSWLSYATLSPCHHRTNKHNSSPPNFPGISRWTLNCAPGDLQHAMALARAYERRVQFSD